MPSLPRTKTVRAICGGFARHALPWFATLAAACQGEIEDPAPLNAARAAGAHGEPGATQSTAPSSAQDVNRVPIHTVRDLLGVISTPAKGFIEDEKAFGFDDIASAFGMTAAQYEQYFKAFARSLEQRVAEPSMQVMGSAMCTPVARPTASYAVGNVPADYSREVRAGLMIDLVAMAVRCDITRVVSFMLDDARSAFVYDFLSERKFSDTGSMPGTGKVAGYHGLQHAGDRNNVFATIGWWNAQKAAELAAKLMAIQEGESGTALDNSVITFASGMHGGDHDAQNLPIALIGGGGRVLETDRHVAFASERRIADVHLTLLQKVFGCPDASFGASAGIIPDLLA